jgi:hypothetical protein
LKPVDESRGRTLPVAKSGLKQGRRCNAGREGTPVLTVVQEGVSGEEPGRPASLIDEIVREGARRMLAEALRAEVDAYIAAFAAERDDNGRRLVVRNGYHEPRELLTSAGAVEVTAPRVNDKRTDPVTGERQRFSSAILPAWARKTPKITQVLPLLYLHGLSSGDFVPALGQFLGSAAASNAAGSSNETSKPRKQRNDEERIPRRLRLRHWWRPGLPAGRLGSPDPRTLPQAPRRHRPAGLAHRRGRPASARADAIDIDDTENRFLAALLQQRK